MKSLLRRRALLVNGGLAVLLIVGAALAYFSLHDDSNASTVSRTTTVQRGDITASVSASGSVESANSRDLSFGTSGTVDSIKVDVGDKVKKGQVLATLDDADARDGVTAAKAALSAAEDGDTSTPSGYSSYVSAKNSYNQAVRTLDATVLKAPFSGTVLAVNGTVGGSSSGSSSSSSSSGSSSSSSAAGSGGGGQGGGGGGGGGAASGSGSNSSSSSSSSSGSGFITVAQTSKLQAKADFTESDVTKLKTGQPADVTFDALQGVSATGKVAEIDQTSTTSNNVVQYGVTVTLTDVPSTVRLGATATVRVTTSSAQNVLYVPSAAVRTAGGQSIVTVLANGKQVTRPVLTGIQGDRGTEIKSGLNEGDQVVITTSGGSGSNFTFPGGGGLSRGGGGLGRGGGGGAVRVPAGGGG